jgi:ketosteroid isomerase-like protein
MSQENIQLVKDVYAAFARRDTPTILAKISPDFEATQSTEVPWGGHYHGPDGLLQFFAKLTSQLNNEALPIDRYLDAGDHVVAIGRTQGTVRANGKRFDVPLAHVWQFKDGCIVRFMPYIDNPTMLASLG